MLIDGICKQVELNWKFIQWTKHNMLSLNSGGLFQHHVFSKGWSVINK